MVCEEKDRERLEGEYNSNLLPLVNEYKYLGIWFDKKWVWNNHIDYVVSKVKSRLNEWKFLIFRNRYLSTITKLRVWNTIIKPLIMYGSEIWWCDKAQMRKIEGL